MLKVGRRAGEPHLKIWERSVDGIIALKLMTDGKSKVAQMDLVLGLHH
jgi:hypothetical protein